MILKFSVSGFRSFGSDEAVLDLRPSKRHTQHPEHLRKAAVGTVLPVAVLYGANASGKSNLVRALNLLQALVLRGVATGHQILLQPHRLAGEDPLPVRIELTFSHQGAIYQYGLLISSPTRVEEEWLTCVPGRGKEKILFERVTREDRVEVECGSLLAKTKDQRLRIGFIAEGTSPEQIFLHKLHDNRVDTVKPVIDWFREELQILTPDSQCQILHKLCREDEPARDFLQELLRVADTGIDALDSKMSPFDLEKPGNLPLAVQQFLASILAENPQAVGRIAELSGAPGQKLAKNYLYRHPDGRLELETLHTTHKGKTGSARQFNLDDESDGTLRLLHLGPSFQTLTQGKGVFVIDELDRSLHPMLSKHLLKLFLAASAEGAESQLIFTTHDTHILDQELIRRDEVFFVEKDQEGASHIECLVNYDFPVRKDLRLEKGYLQGRFGAIPFLGDVRSLLPQKKD